MCKISETEVNNGEVVLDILKSFQYIITAFLLFIMLIIRLLFNIQTEYIKYIFSLTMVDIVYHFSLAYYLVFKCENLMILNNFGLDKKIILLIEKHRYSLETNNNLINKIMKKINSFTFQHKCEEYSTKIENINENIINECQFRDCPCGICFNTLGKAIQLKCNHIFDEECMKKWAIKSYLKKQMIECPKCRVSLM